MSLETSLDNIWKELRKYYMEGKICSERHLQAILFHLMQNETTFDQEFQVFIEPKIYTKPEEGKKNVIHGLIPDMLITHNTQIVAVVELKYCPYSYVPTLKDLQTFSRFQSMQNSPTKILLLTDPQTGNYNETGFTLSVNLLFVYGVIGQEESDAFTLGEILWSDKKYVPQPITRYVYMKGLINKTKEPIFDCIINS